MVWCTGNNTKTYVKKRKYGKIVINKHFLYKNPSCDFKK